MKRSLFTALALLILAFTTACVPPYRQTFNDEGKAKGWTQKQTNAAYAYADKSFWSREAGENKYIILYGRIPTSKVRSQIEGVLHDLDSGLDPKNEEMRQYLETFNLRKDVEHDEEIAEAIYDRIRASELETQFKQKMGDTPEYGPEAEMAQGYSVRKIYVAKSLVDAFPFKSDQIEAAKKNGLLKEIEHAELNFDAAYDHKEADPEHPDDQNAFVWKAKKQSIKLTSYKIVSTEKPLDNHGSYIEGFRVIEGKQETAPALKVFFPEGGESAVVLVDTDEEGQPGFGIPNILDSLSSETRVTDLLTNGNLLSELFDKKEAKKNRVLPENKLFKIEIAKLGAPVDEWTKSTDAAGWIVPFKYSNDRGDNFNVRVHYKKPTPVEIAALIAAGKSHSEYMRIEYIEKEYTKTGDQYVASSGQVIEYYRPKEAFAGDVKAQVLHEDNTKKVSFEFADGSIVEGFVTPKSNKFIEDKPYAKSYTEGDKRWWIQKSSEESDVYDKRKGVGKPKEETGMYGDEEVNDIQAAAFGRSHGSMDGMKPKDAPQPKK